MVQNKAFDSYGPLGLELPVQTEEPLLGAPSGLPEEVNDKHSLKIADMSSKAKARYERYKSNKGFKDLVKKL